MLGKLMFGTLMFGMSIVWHVEVRDVIVDVAGHARDVEVIKGCVMDGSRAELDIRWTRDEGGKNRRCGGERSRESL